MKLHLFQFTNETSAQNDPIIGAYWTPPQDMGPRGIWPGQWDESQTFPNEGVWLTRVAQSGFWIIITSADSNTSLAQHSACRLAWDNDSAVILGGTYTGNEMSALYVAPVPAGAYNPWNGPAP